MTKADREPLNPSEIKSTQNSESFYAWVIIAASLMITIPNYGVRMSYSVFFKPMMEDFGWTRAMTSGPYSLAVVTLGVFSIVFGWLSDRHGPRITLTLCGIFSGIGITLLSQVNNLWQLYLYFGIIAGVGAAAFVPLTTSITGWFDKKKGLALGIVVAGMALGPTITAPLANYFISLYGWRRTFVIFGVIAGIVIVLAAQFIKSGPRKVNAMSPADNNINRLKAIESADICETRHAVCGNELTVKSAIRKKKFWLITIPYGFWCLAIIAVPVHMVPLITDKGIPSADAANILSLLMAASMIGRIVMGAVSDRIGRVRSLNICLGFNMIALFLLMFANSLLMFSLFACVYGFTYGGGVPQWAALAGDTFGIVAMGAIFGTIVFFVTIFGTLGPILFGYIFDVTGSYNIAFLISVLLIGFAIVILGFIKGQKKDHELTRP